MSTLFAYSWCYETHRDENSFLRIYGIGEKPNTTICLRVRKFSRYFYVQLPNKNCQYFVSNYIKDAYNAVKIKLEMKCKLYSSSNQKLPFLKCCFLTSLDVNRAAYSLNNKAVLIPGCGKRILKPYENQAEPILQLITRQNLEISGWLKFKGKEIFNDDKMTRCDQEFVVDAKDLARGDSTNIIEPIILCFDLEVYSSNHNCMPCDKPGDVIFQISCVFKTEKILLSLKRVGEIPGTDVRLFETEKQLLQAFIELVKFKKPNVLAGYNILGFDIPYLIKRCTRLFLIDELRNMGYNCEIPANEIEVAWSSSAFNDQKFKFLDWEGILLLDLLPIVQRDYKIDNYRLQTIASKFLDTGKDPLTAKDLFVAYEDGELTQVGEYCIKDSVLVLQLIEKFQTWVALVEMSKVCNVTMFSLFTKGQQIKVYSMVYKHCYENNIVVDSASYGTKTNEKYVGAYE